METQVNQKIKFNKTIENPEELKKFCDGKKGTCDENIYYQPDPLSIAKDYCTRLETRLKGVGYKVKNTDVGRLWISEPSQFSLSLDVTTDNCLPISRQIGIRTEKKLFKKKEIPILELFYRAHINGEVYYQNATKNEPDQMIEILSAEGYANEVMTTPKLTEELVERLRTPVHIHHHESYDSEAGWGDGYPC